MHPVRLAHITALLALGGCTNAASPITATTAARDLATLQQGAAEGQLFCQAGPLVLGLFDPSGAALLAKGATGAAVASACAAVGGVAVALQDVSVTPQGVTVVLPPSVVVPLKVVGKQGAR